MDFDKKQIDDVLEVAHKELEKLFLSKVDELAILWVESFPNKKLTIFAGGMGTGVSYSISDSRYLKDFESYGLRNNIFKMRFYEKLKPLVYLSDFFDGIIGESIYLDCGILEISKNGVVEIPRSTYQ